MKTPTTAFLSILLLAVPTCARGRPVERAIKIMNESGRRVEIHWIHPDTGELVLQSTPDVLNGASFALNSFVGHSFEVNELVRVMSWGSWALFGVGLCVCVGVICDFSCCLPSFVSHIFGLKIMI